MSKLAINNGPKAVTLDANEQWKPPIEKQKAAVCDLVERGIISCSGEDIPKQFEDEFKEFIGCKYVLATSHGHTALASAFFAAGLGTGDEFISPTLGYIGSYAAALHMGATPVFCEADPDTLLADPKDIEKRITPKTRVLCPIHFNGRVCDLDAMLDLCEKHNLVLLEDAAHAHGSEWDGKRIGNVGHIACFSMQGNDPGGKPVTGGEGGIIATNDRALYERALSYCHLHRPGSLDTLAGHETLRHLESQLLGWKWRAHPLALALGRISLQNLPYRLEQYAAHRDEFLEQIQGIPGIMPVKKYAKSRNSELYGGLAFIYDSNALGGLELDRFCQALEAEGVPLCPRAFRDPEHLRSIYTREMPGLWGKNHPGPGDLPLPRYQEGDYPVSEALQKATFVMPGWINAAPGAISQVAQAMRKVVDHHGELVEQPCCATA